MSTRRAVLLDAGTTGPRAREAGALPASLAARGFTLERLADPARVLTALVERPADVLIIDADSPSLDLREFVEALRREPLTTHTLVVALTAGDPRELPARREIALVLAKPINADEAASRLEGLVVTRQRAATNARELRGDLAQLALPDLLQLLAVGRASGTLAVDAGSRRGSLVLDGGDLRDVACGPTTGIKAFVRLLMLTEGAFVFTHGAVETIPGGEALSLNAALFEATRQTDDIVRFRAHLPEPWVELRRSRQTTSEEFAKRIDTTPALTEVARLLAVPRTLASLLDASPLSDADLLEALEAFRREGLVESAGATAGDRATVLEGPYAAALAARLSEGGRNAHARVLVLVDPVTGEASGIAVARALGGIAGFVAAEGAGALVGGLPLGPLGALTVGDVKLELFAVPAEREMLPLWAVFGARAQAAIVAAPLHDDHQGERILAAEIGVPVATVQGAMTAQSVADALRGALEQLIPRR